MSFGRLLAAGKSLIGLRGGETRYRQSKQARLPKFGSPKNPFARAEKPPVVTVTETPKADGPTARSVEASLKPTRSTARPAGWLGDWGRKLNPFGPRRTGAKPAAPARQTELALDRVRVVRNDLSDADLPGAKSAAALPGTVSPMMALTLEKLEPVGAACSRLAARFIGVDQT